MPKIVTLYHKEDGAVDFKSADVSEVLIHKDEWSDKPWTKDQVDQAPAPILAQGDGDRPRTKKPRPVDEPAVTK